MKFLSERNIGDGEFFRISLFTTGVKKRCRKVDRHLLNMGYSEYKETLSDEDRASLEEAARNLVGRAMRSLYTNDAHISLDRVTRTAEYCDTLKRTWHNEKWEPFSELNQKVEICV